MKLKKKLIVLLILILTLPSSFVFALETNVEINSESAILIDSSTRHDIVF